MAQASFAAATNALNSVRLRGESVKTGIHSDLPAKRRAWVHGWTTRDLSGEP